VLLFLIDHIARFILHTTKNKVKTINLETQRDEAATKTKSKTTNLETQK